MLNGNCGVPLGKLQRKSILRWLELRSLTRSPAPKCEQELNSRLRRTRHPHAEAAVSEGLPCASHSNKFAKLGQRKCRRMRVWGVESRIGDRGWDAACPSARPADRPPLNPGLRQLRVSKRRQRQKRKASTTTTTATTGTVIHTAATPAFQPRQHHQRQQQQQQQQRWSVSLRVVLVS
ncbi:hypothetical protein C0Q70_17422 [Pomacea canaliculata]|uniref:Uncharacterized protein n=1 Tax=Pomacea canaliculata TaxID=400727 RepID=A0A2T7NKD1_POMCA|nr:hypothetical protein C0Q70_17422 [Pomacea canaliculata]